MIDEQAGQSTPAPRQWNEGDTEPPRDVKLLQGFHRDHTDSQYLVRCRMGGWLWSHQAGTDRATGFEWADVLWLASSPLTEVVPPSSVSPSGENTTTVVPRDPETGTGDLRDGLADLLDAAMERNQRASLDAIEAWDFDVDLLPLADAILAAGWRPPLPDSETERQRWFVIAGPGTPTELGERPLEADWDGIVYPGLTADLAASLAACRQTYDDWGVYELVRVEDPEVTS